MTERRHPIAEQRARNARIRAHAEQAARGEPREAGTAEPFVAVVPANTRQTEPVPAEVRAAFLDRLTETLEALQARDAEDSADSAETVAPEAHDWMPTVDQERIDAMAAMSGRACGVCKGECCTAGGDHAFLRAESLVRIRREHPALSDAALHAEYDAFIPVRHYRGSCLFHTPTGCTLPRTLRADLCNRYTCGGLTQLLRALDASGDRRAFVGSADSVHLRRLAVVTPDDTSVVALT